MSTLDEQRQTAEFVDVVTWEDDVKFPVYRFPNDEAGHRRAVEYRNAFNDSLRKAMGVTEADLELEQPSHRERPEEYERAELAAMYRSDSAALSYLRSPKVVGNDDPMPTDYPHNF